MPLIHITSCRTLRRPNRPFEGYVDSPATGDTSDFYSFPLVGWVLGHEAPVEQVRLSCKGVQLAMVRVDQARPDLVKSFPGFPWVKNCAFTTRVPGLALPTEFELCIEACVNGTTNWEALAIVRGWRKPVKTTFAPTIQPLVVITIGRTGSTWLTTLLNDLPGVTACRPFHYETRVVNYWIAVLRMLAQPASHQQMIAPESTPNIWWTGRDRLSPLPPSLPDEPIEALLSRDNVNATADFAMGRIEAFFRRTADMRGRTDIKYFAEKYSPHPLLSPMIRELYPKSKQIFLVRDFRDVACSVMDYHKRDVAHDPFGIDRAGGSAGFMKEHISRVEGLLTAWRGSKGQAHLVRYEDIISDPVTTMVGVCRYLGTDATREQVARSVETARANEPDRQRNHRTAGSALASVQRWKRDLPGDLREACEKGLAEAMREFGYVG